MCLFETIFFHRDKLKTMLHKNCPWRASLIFRYIPSDIMSLTQIARPWNSTEDTAEFNGIPPNILLMSEIEGLKREIESLNGKITNQLQDELDERGFSSTEHNNKTTIDAMASQTKHITE